MLDGSSSVPPALVRCRQITEADLDAIVGLLIEGFVDRTEAYWRRGLDRHIARPPPKDLPRYGFMLESDGRPVGVLLTLHTEVVVAGRAAIRCNLSSWYVAPAFRAQAAMLDAAAQRRKTVTYLNVTPSPLTFALQEARGFQRFCKGQVFGLPWLARPSHGVSARLVSEHDALDDLLPADRTLLRDHISYGCIGFVVTRNGDSRPLIFLRRRIGMVRRQMGSGPIPCFQLLYCHDMADLGSYIGAVGRKLLVRFGMPWIVVDAVGPIPGLPGRYFEGRAPKYCRGPDPVRLGDLSYTELVFFGP